MIVDSSALIAVLRGEADAPDYAAALSHPSEAKKMSAANYLETAIVIDGSRDPIASRRVNDLMKKAGILIESVTPEQAEIARAAYRDYGKGSGHKAALNFGDCFAYALARSADEPLLFKGDDFRHTDIKVWRKTH
jgi:ribonuclease VapC